jgi:hypothetical protein
LLLGAADVLLGEVDDGERGPALLAPVARIAASADRALEALGLSRPAATLQAG